MKKTSGIQRAGMVLAAVVTIMLQTVASAQAVGPQEATVTGNRLRDIVKTHPAGEVLARIFADSAAALPDRFQPTGFTKKDYLSLIAGNVDFWKHFQDAQGAILDPYEKDALNPAGKERQYSTPAFALAAALLVKEAGRNDLLDAAARAMSFATAALANKTSADKHADFYIPMLMHARRILKDRVSNDLVAKWDQQFRGLIPEKTYIDNLGGSNWNLVNVCGEFLRRHDDLVPEDRKDAHLAYLNGCLKRQENQFTRFGMYADSYAPLAYDVFPRLWLEDALADGAITGSWGNRIDERLTQGGLSGLLILSPSGEWACGGRSAHHQWNEAANVAIAEINAVRWMKLGRPDMAGAFKRAAHLAFASMRRWQRPSGEMWIVKNFADPSLRFGFEDYSFNSQYNLLAVAMLALACERADDSIAERPTPAEAAGYVFDFRDTFHHIVAACGGYYLLIDTSADPRYGSTGLQRIHRSGVDLSPLTDTPGSARHYGPANPTTRAALAAGIQWKQGVDEPWLGLAHCLVEQTELAVTEQTPQRVAFSIAYRLAGESAALLEERYVITPRGVQGTSRLTAGKSPVATRVVLPALINDGARMTDLSLDQARLTITRHGALVPIADKWAANPGGSMQWELIEPAGLKLHLTGPPIITHNGYVQAIAADLPRGTREVTWRMTLESSTDK